MSYRKLLNDVSNYYGRKLESFGATAQGVNWNSDESQRLRFAQLLRLVDVRRRFSINDYGCGYGAFVEYLRETGCSFAYCGFDISPQMIAKAKELYAGTSDVCFVSESSELGLADYTVASGVFNVRLNTPASEWEAYVLDTLQVMDQLSRHGFAFNLLTKYSDMEFMRDDLYYADPLFLFDYCKKHFSRFVSLIHEYPLYEFTILVRKEQR